MAKCTDIITKECGHWGIPGSSAEAHPYTEYQTVGIWMIVAATAMVFLLFFANCGPFFMCFFKKSKGGNKSRNPFIEGGSGHFLLYLLIFLLLVTGVLSLFKDNDPELVDKFK